MKAKSGEESRKVVTRAMANDQANKELVALMRAQQNALNAKASGPPKTESVVNQRSIPATAQIASTHEVAKGSK